MTKKIWILAKDIDNETKEWVKNSTLQYIVVKPEYTMMDYNCTSVPVVTKAAELHIVTKSEKDEILLMLKVGDKISLLSAEKYSAKYNIF